MMTAPTSHLAALLVLMLSPEAVHGDELGLHADVIRDACVAKNGRLYRFQSTNAITNAPVDNTRFMLLPPRARCTNSLTMGVKFERSTIGTCCHVEQSSYNATTVL
eukprot:m.8313 g.8313  ORF g.8313 m.8313 type:complete len:106 (+) comp9142_c0_seq3:186-503(+)